jgi:hypothetical protein
MLNTKSLYINFFLKNIICKKYIKKFQRLENLKNNFSLSYYIIY